MSQYVTSPFKPSPVLLVPGIPEYLLGSYLDKTGPTIGTVISDSAATVTATLVFVIRSGNVPKTGSLITVIGAANSANFNVTNVAITVVSCTDAGVCTVTYAISSTTQASLADGGQVIIPQPEVGETISAAVYNSVPAVMPYGDATNNLNQAITAVAAFTTFPTTGVVTLQQAVFDVDSEYATVATVATVTAGALVAGDQITVDPTLGRFFRLHVEQSGGAVIVGKLLM